MDIKTTERLIEKTQTSDTLSNELRSELLSVLHAYKKEADRDRLIDALSQITDEKVLSGSWNETVRNCFEKIGEGIHVDRIVYFEYGIQEESGAPGLISNIAWESQTDADNSKNVQKQRFLPKKNYKKLLKTLEMGSHYQSRFGGQSINALKKLMKDEKCRSVLFLPVRSNGTFYGAIRFDNCQQDKEWQPSELTLLQPLLFQFRNILEKRDLENQLQKTYRQAQIGTWEMDVERGTHFWSAVTKEIFEMDQDAVPDDQLAMKFFYDDKSRERFLQAVERAQITGEPYDMELPVKTAKGNVKWIRDTGQALFRNGKCVKLYGIVQDIHKRKIAESESEKNKQLLEAITQQTDMAVWVRDERGTILFVNKQWKSIFGFDQESVSGRSMFDLFEKRRADSMVGSDRKVIQKNEQVVFEEFIDTAKGPRHFMVNKFPLKGVSGLENAVGGIGTDITEIKETEERLQRAEEKLREIIEHSTNLFYTHDVNHKLTYLSPQSIDFLGYHPEKAKRRWTEFVTGHPDNGPGFASTQRAIDTGKAQPPFELQLKRGDGEIIWVEVNEAPVIKEGKTVSIAGSLTNITKRKEAQGKIQESLKEKETLLAEIHHRVKNNLAVVASLMQLQAMESENEAVRGELLESVLRVKSMAGIHEHLYKTDDFSNLDFAHNLKVLVKDIIDTMQSSAQISIEFECSDVSLSVNQAIPCSLIINEVVTNIIKHGFRDKQKGTVQVRLHQEIDKIEITITDNGDGFPENFDPESTNTLGMQLIKTLSSQLFGSYNFQSRDVGAVFTLLFEKDADQSVPNL